MLSLPVFAYALLAAPVKTGWRLQGTAAAATAAAYALAFGLVFGLGTDAARLTTDYNLDSAIHCFGLNVGMALDLSRGSGSGDAQGDFVVLETEPPVSEQIPTESQEPDETEPVVYEPNVMDFDFAQLAAGRIATAEFLAALMVTSPQSFLPPLITYFSKATPLLRF